MVCTADDLRCWNDFPKGLRVLLLAEDSSFAEEIRSKLEDMDYIVCSFYNEDEALLEVSKKQESFHIAIVEVNMSNDYGGFKFLETAKDLPIIITSNVHCLSTVMKCIALGAVEFLQKPLSEDKLRNIWQHVVHKAFHAGSNGAPELLNPVKDSAVSSQRFNTENGELKDQFIEERKTTSYENECEQGSDKYPAPSTPQLKHGSRLVDDGDCQDQTNFSTEKENSDPDVESKSVETTCGDLSPSVTVPVNKTLGPGETKLKEEEDVADVSTSPHKETGDGQSIQHADQCNSGKVSGKVSRIQEPCANKPNRKKTKVDWTPELHKKFVQAVEQLGLDQAIPSRILELMKVEGLTRHNVASHLQKYRMHRRHILPKEDDRRWIQSKDPMQRSYYPHKQFLAYPTYHSHHTLPAGSVYPMWGSPNGHQPGVQYWGPPYYPSWPPHPESWHWKPYPAMHADAWGCPIVAPPNGPGSYPQSVHGYSGACSGNKSWDSTRNSFEFHPAEEVIDKVVKEAISNPWQPLPLGLKPPSTESVLAELCRQGISRIPPRRSNTNPL